MKTLITIILCLFTSEIVFADCTSRGVWVFPQTETIKQNSWVILEGYAYSQKIITDLNSKYPIYLEAEGHKVKLLVKDTCKGMFELSQAILVPQEKLISGKKYQLKIDNLNEDDKELLTRWNSKTRESEAIIWEVTEGTDSNVPEFLSQPELIDKRTIHYGCGPAIYADFKLKIKDESITLFKTELVDLETGQSNTYYLYFDKPNVISVGHGMCSGAFDYQKGKKYRIRFRPMDICGNESKTWTNWVEFDSPFKAFR